MIEFAAWVEKQDKYVQDFVKKNRITNPGELLSSLIEEKERLKGMLNTRQGAIMAQNPFSGEFKTEPTLDYKAIKVHLELVEKIIKIVMEDFGK